MDFEDPPYANAHCIHLLKATKDKKDVDLIDKEIFQSSVELYIRKMISLCATEIVMPAYSKEYWATPKRIKALLTPNSRKHIKFADQRDAVWSNVRKYFSSMIQDCGESRDGLGNVLFDIASQFYLLIMASKFKCELFLSPIFANELINSIINAPYLSLESKSRLSTIQGIYNLYVEDNDIAGFYCRPTMGKQFSERIDEIMEDAYLLEASTIRRLIGIKENAASLKRDLRKLVKAIVKNRSWAKELLGIVSEVAWRPNGTDKVIASLLNIVPSLNGESAPILLMPSKSRFGTACVVHEGVKYLFSKQQTWISSFSYLETENGFPLRLGVIGHLQKNEAS